ncbi:enoyl-CoA hydratase/isomerase family protein [Gordonia rubripertincta]|uniref:enoyl-CoA hydratase/isomerase family protein n=1 Tax=Gordonia rubripertincta TaxID=36822 RepID=UPI000B8DB70E|nr:enoyl-CoA hydratase/isomerase family protein [Gordonia rubripertincta]ASR03070.1 1,2-epoxyphenylacetyl-CoA isomerase [Gordonia rubripertincta]
MTVSVTRPAEGITQITLSRPEALNTLDRRLTGDLVTALDEVEADTDCRVVIVTGAGRAFCAGLDLNGYLPPDGWADELDRLGRAQAQLVIQREIAGLAQRLHSLRQPVIAAVNGPAAGGGLALVAASDIRIAAPEAVFAVSFIRAGFSACDIGVSWLLPRLIGAGRAHELMLTGRRFSAEYAREIGLVTDVVPAGELLDRAMELAAEIMLNPPISVELTKQGMWLALETPGFDAAVEFENRQQVFTSFTEDQPEAVAAFLGKRSPRYRRR